MWLHLLMSIDVVHLYSISSLLIKKFKSQLLAEAVGEPIAIPHETACSTRDYVANDLSAFASLQPMLDVLWEEEPDFLD